jgi:hypothetical protein
LHTNLRPSVAIALDPGTAWQHFSLYYISTLLVIVRQDDKVPLLRSVMERFVTEAWPTLAP